MIIYTGAGEAKGFCGANSVFNQLITEGRCNIWASHSSGGKSVERKLVGGVGTRLLPLKC